MNGERGKGKYNFVTSQERLKNVAKKPPEMVKGNKNGCTCPAGPGRCIM